VRRAGSCRAGRCRGQPSGGGLAAGTPKVLLPCGDRAFLAWLLREFVRFGVTDFLLLTGPLSAEVAQAVAVIQASLPRPARVRLSEQSVCAGTGGAIFHARDRLVERFLVCNANSLFDANLAILLADAAVDRPGVVGRIMLRRLDDASRHGVVALDGDRITAFRACLPSGPAGLMDTGIHLFRKTLIDSLGPACSLESDVLPGLAAAGTLRGTLAEGTFRAIEAAGDLPIAQTEIPGRLRRRALFLDRDGVLNIDRGYVGSADRFEWVGGALDAIRYATGAGWHVFIVTNQSGVARGFYGEAAVRTLLDWIGDEARRNGGTIDDWRYCPFHPEATVKAYRQAHEWRKPLPGMLLDLLRAWQVEPSRAVMIGDQASDMHAAAAAGVAGHLFLGGNLLGFLRPILDARA